jgi:hypothetical protein
MYIKLLGFPHTTKKVHTKHQKISHSGLRNTLCLLLVLCCQWISRRLPEWVPGEGWPSGFWKNLSAASDNKSGLNAGTRFGGRLNGERRNKRDLGEKEKL